MGAKLKGINVRGLFSNLPMRKVAKMAMEKNITCASENYVFNEFTCSSCATDTFSKSAKPESRREGRRKKNKILHEYTSVNHNIQSTTDI